MKKKIGIALLAIALLGGLAFAADNCKYYSTNPSGQYGAGLRANLSGRTIRVESSISEPVKITSVKVGTTELVWDVTGDLRLGIRGGTELQIPATVNLRAGASLIVLAESCD
jgi:hypothetical protein